MKRSGKSMITVFAMLAIGVSTVAVEGLPTCKRLIKTYKEHRVRNPPPSQAVLNAWALWGKSHPDYVSSNKRPKYKKTREEVVQQVQFACEVPVEPTPVPDLPAPVIGTVEFPGTPLDLLPPELPLPAVAMNYPVLPFIPPYSPGIPLQPVSPVPEPSSLLLMLTGVLFLVLLARQGKLRLPQHS